MPHARTTNRACFQLLDEQLLESKDRAREAQQELERLQGEGVRVKEYSTKKGFKIVLPNFEDGAKPEELVK